MVFVVDVEVDPFPDGSMLAESKTEERERGLPMLVKPRALNKLTMCAQCFLSFGLRVGFCGFHV